MEQLVSEVEKAIRITKKNLLTPCFRLNGTSDIRWETVPCERNGQTFDNIMTAFPDVQFYDYRKLNKWENLPSNYHLTFSLNEANMNTAEHTPLNVAVVFRKALPAMFMGRKVIDGTTTDLRFLDPKGVVVGLVAKGRARKDTSGFVQDFV